MVQMVRVVILGEFRVDRLVPTLRDGGAEVTVLGSVDLGSFLGPGVTCGELPAVMSEQALLHLLRDHRADVALPNMGCRGQEQFLLSYARAASRVRAAGAGLGAGCRMPVHSERFALLASDKVALHRLAGERGWPVPRGVVCADGRALAGAVEELGFPALVKEARSEFGAGRHYVRDRGHLNRVSGEVTYPVLVQETVRGEEFAVEFLSGPTRTVAWPVASLGRLDGDCAPGRRVRVAPAALPAAAAGELAGTVADVVAAFGPVGPWQMDLAVTDDGRLRVFELNGRLSGVSNMSWASTGLDPHVAYARTALGFAPPVPRADRIALELPVPNGAVLPAGPTGTEVMPHPGTPANQGPWNGGYHRPVLRLPEGRAEAARAWLRSLPPGVLLNSADEAVAQLGRGLDGLRQGGGLPA
ncbi:ATP-grasp domain-containing protein [Streptomyces cinnamoneus]|uniref:ATP-grasp domain-containing protein n=1 Tax=Streptomyces cinnamoneus TaxID=53446 RepID=UPI0033EA5503